MSAHRLREEDDYDPAREEWELSEYEKLPRCGCPFCFCLTKTEYGESCSDCLVGAHQG